MKQEFYDNEEVYEKEIRDKVKEVMNLCAHNGIPAIINVTYARTENEEGLSAGETWLVCFKEREPNPYRAIAKLLNFELKKDDPRHIFNIKDKERIVF